MNTCHPLTELLVCYSIVRRYASYWTRRTLPDLSRVSTQSVTFYLWFLQQSHTRVTIFIFSINGCILYTYFKNSFVSFELLMETFVPDHLCPRHSFLKMKIIV